MRSIFFILMFFAAFVLLGPPLTHAQQPVGDWSNVESLRARTRVVVEAKDGTTVKGRIVSTTADSISVSADGRVSSFARDNVESVHLGRRGSILKRAFLGAGVGALVGLGAGAAATFATGEGRGLLAAQGLLYGIPAGAAIGAATGGKIKAGRLIYRAP